ncbi:MAG: hypothetical protein IPF99_31170 [Deltaproteobacteria bacterium]|nr:hypothetical protein [Deltaproteobacteria bacterium]
MPGTIVTISDQWRVMVGSCGDREDRMREIDPSPGLAATREEAIDLPASGRTQRRGPDDPVPLVLDQVPRIPAWKYVCRGRHIRRVHLASRLLATHFQRFSPQLPTRAEFQVPLLALWKAPELKRFRGLRHFRQTYRGWADIPLRMLTPTLFVVRIVIAVASGR